MKTPLPILSVILLLSLPVTASAADATEKTLSLRECIDIALKNATTVAKAENMLRLEGTDVLKSYGSFLPKVSAAATYVPWSVSRSYAERSSLETGVTRVRTDTETLDLTLTASLNIFNGLRDYASLRAALDRQKAAGHTVWRAKQTVVFDITQHYYQVLLDGELLGIAQENLRSAKDLLTLTDRQFQIGLKSAADLYQQQAEVGNNELSAIRAETRLRRSKLELLRRLRIDPRTALSLEPVPGGMEDSPILSSDPDTLAGYGLRHRRDLLALERETAASRWEITRAAGSRYPSLDLNFNVSTSAVESFSQTIGGQTLAYTYPPVSDQLTGLVGYSLVLSMNWPIFDGFLTRYSVESARVSHLNQQLDLDDLKKGILIDLQQVAGDYRAALKQIETARLNLRAAQSAFDSVRKKYELGASGFVELSASRAVLFNAKSSQTQATYNLALQKSILDYTAGRTDIHE